MKYIYACITDKCIRPIEEVQKTRKYKKALELKEMLNIESFEVDICSSWNRKKLNLENILASKNNIIIVTDLSALGKKDEIGTVYQRIIETGNDILIAYFSDSGIIEADEKSTVDMNYQKKENFDLQSALNSLDNISTTQFRVESCRIVDKSIIEAYWKIEKNEMTERDALKELNISKPTFIKRVNDYIRTDGWFTRYRHEIENTNITNIPIMLGSVSDNGKKVNEFLKNNPGIIEQYDSLYIALSFSKVEEELYKKIDPELYDDPKEAEQHLNKFIVLMHHYYRESLRYDRHLTYLKYKK